MYTGPLMLAPGGRMGHYHVFTPGSMLAVVVWMKGQGLCDWRLVAREDVDTKVGNGFTLAFRRYLDGVRGEPQGDGEDHDWYWN